MCPLILEDLGLFCYIILQLILTTLFPVLSLPVQGTGSNIHELITAVLQTGIHKWQMWVCGISFRIPEEKNTVSFPWPVDWKLLRAAEFLKLWKSTADDCLTRVFNFFFTPPFLSAYHRSLLSQVLSQCILWCSGNYHILVLAW